MTKWTEQAWKTAEPIYEKILDLPFLHELIAGSLAREKFLFYLKQDALYLSEYGKILAGIAAKLDRKAWREAFLHFSADTVSVEQALHQYFLKDEAPAVMPSPSCMLYTGHMYRQLANGSTEEVLASVLPCFWVYQKVGNYIVERQTQNENPYQSWIDTYGGEEFARAVQTALEICNETAAACTDAGREAMTRAFLLSFKMEWMFWNSAWNMEQWPV
ncbi:TenA family protein [Gaoshiqia sp. Z1-71]|uniref:TenA family protein n=1 Tax=Gaoshiqia hydrogeniformans TaxID=3290090 RepID=UPI003BF7DAD5